MNCTICRELLVAYMEDLLESSESDGVYSYLLEKN